MERCRGDYLRLEAALEDASLRADEDLIRIIHKLAGASGTFGYPELGRIAAEADDRLAEGHALTDHDLTQILGCMRRSGVN